MNRVTIRTKDLLLKYSQNQESIKSNLKMSILLKKHLKDLFCWEKDSWINCIRLEKDYMLLLEWYLKRSRLLDQIATLLMRPKMNTEIFKRIYVSSRLIILEERFTNQAITLNCWKKIMSKLFQYWRDIISGSSKAKQIQNKYFNRYSLICFIVFIPWDSKMLQSLIQYTKDSRREMV